MSNENKIMEDFEKYQYFYLYIKSMTKKQVDKYLAYILIIKNLSQNERR